MQKGYLQCNDTVLKSTIYSQIYLNYSRETQSPTIGATITAMPSAGISHAHVQILGWWKSNKYQEYVIGLHPWSQALFKRYLHTRNNFQHTFILNEDNYVRMLFSYCILCQFEFAVYAPHCYPYLSSLIKDLYTYKLFHTSWI